MQIDSVQGDEDLRLLFYDDDNASLLLDTGFRKPLACLTCSDKALLKDTLRDYHTLVKIKPELDQFADGLETLGVLQALKKYPSLMAPLFAHEKREINKGILLDNEPGHHDLIKCVA